jgi:hypothetical protein
VPEADRRAERELDEAVSGLYATFGRYRVLDGIDASELNRLAAAPLTELTADDLRSFALKSLPTRPAALKPAPSASEEPSLKHLLPRLLEIAAGTPPWAELETPVLLRKLLNAGWTDWPLDEVAAVTHYLDAVWRAVLVRDHPAWRAGQWLAAIGGAVETLQPYLEAWCQLAAEQPAALRQLAQFVQVEGVSAVRRRRLVDVWWGQRPTQAAEVLAWLVSDTPRAVLAAGFLAHDAEPWATDVAEAEWVLAWLQQQAGA